jgi:hypothetical protein
MIKKKEDNFFSKEIFLKIIVATASVVFDASDVFLSG